MARAGPRGFPAPKLVYSSPCASGPRRSRRRVIKRVLCQLWAGWKRFAHGLGVVNRWVLLTVFYFVAVNIVNLCLRTFRIDLLDRRPASMPTYWRPRDLRHGSYHQQF